MMNFAEEKRRILTKRVVIATAYQSGRRMVAIGRIPRTAQAFFRPLRKHFARPAPRFCSALYTWGSWLWAKRPEAKKPVLRLPPISHLKTRMRQVVWQEAIEDVVRHSDDKPVIRRLEKLLAAQNRSV